LFYEENIFSPKNIKKPESCSDIESKVSDSLNIRMFHIRYYQIGVNNFALRFSDIEDNYDKKAMKNRGNDYLIILDQQCEVIKGIKDSSASY